MGQMELSKQVFGDPECYIGVDPGQTGAIGLIDAGGNYADHIKLDSTDRDVFNWLKKYKGRVTFAMLEKVHSMPKQGVASSFKFGRSFGFCAGMLIASEIRFEYVTPQKWMKKMRCMTGGNKNVTKSLAQQLWPTTKIIHANADALLLAEYGRRMRKGML